MHTERYSHGGSYFIVSLQELDSEGSKLQEPLVAGREPTMNDIITKLGEARVQCKSEVSA